MTFIQHLKIKSSIVDANNYLNENFLSFDTLSNEFSPRNKLTDSFLNHLLFHIINHKDKKSKNSHLHILNKIVFEVSLKANSVIIVLDTSIKNNIATFINHIHSCSNLIKKILYYAINITTNETELFTIRCEISQTTQLPNIFHIIIITDSIYTAQRIFDSFTHFYQLQLITISKNLRSYINTQIIPSNSRITQAIISGHFTHLLTITLKSSISILFISTRYYGTLARRKNTIIISKIGE